jgi:hypothetical protein
VLQQLLPLQPPPPPPAAAEEQPGGEGGTSTADDGEQQQASLPLQLPAADVVSLIEQLSAIARQRNGSSSSSAAAASPQVNAFLEDQALQQILPLVSQPCGVLSCSVAC